MWLYRMLAVCALVAAVVAIAVVALHPVRSAPAASEPPKPTATPRAAVAAVPPVVGEVSGTAAKRLPVPILMYHVVSKAPAGVPNPQLWVDEAVFADELRALHAAGYTAVTLQQVWDGWRDGGPLPRKPVVISFDDGYLSHYTHARPVLRELGWPGVLYLTTRNIGPDGLTDHQVRSLIRDGWEIDSHTRTHPDLTTLDDTALARELTVSRRELQRRFGVPVRFFAYPSGRYDARVQAATEAAGYLAATTVKEGIATRRDAPFALPRVRVDAADTADTLLARLR